MNETPDGMPISHHGWGRMADSQIVQLASCERSRVVMHDRGEDTYERYAVHTEVLPGDRPPFLIYGHYTDDLVGATREFGDRALRDAKRLTLEAESVERLARIRGEELPRVI